MTHEFEDTWLSDDPLKELDDAVNPTAHLGHQPQVLGSRALAKTQGPTVSREPRPGWGE